MRKAGRLWYYQEYTATRGGPTASDAVGPPYIMADKKEKILIIEDDQFLLKIYSNKLRAEGFEVSQAAEGNEGLRKVTDEKPDLIILDLILPGKNGFDILAEIKTNDETKDIPVLILSNLGQDKDIKRGLEMGAVDYFVKTDIKLSDVLGKVREHLLKAKMKKEGTGT